MAERGKERPRNYISFSRIPSGLLMFRTNKRNNKIVTGARHVYGVG